MSLHYAEEDLKRFFALLKLQIIFSGVCLFGVFLLVNAVVFKMQSNQVVVPGFHLFCFHSEYAIIVINKQIKILKNRKHLWERLKETNGSCNENI